MSQKFVDIVDWNEMLSDTIREHNLALNSDARASLGELGKSMNGLFGLGKRV